MKTASQIQSQIADLKARPKTPSVQAQIESLQRKLHQILSADKKDVRKLKTRATFILGSTVIGAAEQPDGQHILVWLRDRVRSLSAKDQDVVRTAFPDLFPGASAPATDVLLPAQPAAHQTKETTNG